MQITIDPYTVTAAIAIIMIVAALITGIVQEVRA